MRMNDMLTVGEFARQAGVTPKTVRFYEEIGVLPPARRGPNGYRRYYEQDVNQLLFIQRAKALGLTLDEIQKLIPVAENGRCSLTRAELHAILERKIADCTLRIDALVAFRADLEDAAQRLLRDDVGERCCPIDSAFAPDCGCVPVIHESTGIE